MWATVPSDRSGQVEKMLSRTVSRPRPSRATFLSVELDLDIPRRRIALVTNPVDRGGRFFDTSAQAGNRDGLREPFALLRQLLAAKAIELTTLDHWDDLPAQDLVVFQIRDRATLGETLRRGLGARTAYLAWEPPVVEPLHSREGLHRLAGWFGRILTWDPGAVDGRTFLALHYPHQLGPVLLSPLPFEDRGLLVNISGNKTSSHPLELYSERERIISGFEALDPTFELWGPGWDRSIHPSWRGLAPSKAEVYHRFRFALCLENMRDTPGYATEKLFDALMWGTIPVYQGDPLLSPLLPPQAWVDYGSLGSPEALHQHVCSWTPERHAQGLAAGAAFLASEAAAPWRAAFLAHQLELALDLAQSAPRAPSPSLGDFAGIRLAWLRRRLWKAP